MHLSNTALLAVIGYASGIAAHGIVKGLEAGGQSMTGYQPHAWTKEPTAGWSIPTDQNHGFINPSKYQNPDIICHVGATPGQLSLTVAAGDSVGLQWTSWPEGHHGNVVNYLANCRGRCEDVDKTTLEFNKMDERGLISPNPNYRIGQFMSNTITGHWAGDDLRANGSKAWFKVPEWLAAGNYVLRHELMALHDAMPEGTGIQHYPQCINLIVTGGGSDSLDSGTLGTDLYRADQPGVVVNIFRNPGEYTVPGPPVYVPRNGKAAPKMSSKRPSKTEVPRGQYSFAPMGESSPAPEKTPVPQLTPSQSTYPNSTIISSLPQATEAAATRNQGSYDYTGLDATKSDYGSEPKKTEVPVVDNDASNSGQNQKEEAGKSNDYNYDLSPGVNSSDGKTDDNTDGSGDGHGDGNAGGYNDDVPNDSSPDTHSRITDQATDASLDPSITSLLDLIQKTLDQLRKKLLSGTKHKRHARDLGF